MPKSLDLIKSIWNEFEAVFELFIYLAIAYVMHLLFSITYVQAVIIVFVYFTLALLRIIVEAYRNKNLR